MNNKGQKDTNKITYLHRILFYFPVGILIVVLGLFINYQSLMFIRNHNTKNNILTIPSTIKIKNNNYYCVHESKEFFNIKFKLDCNSYKDTFKEGDNVLYNIEINQVKNMILIIYLIGFTLVAIGIVFFLYHIRAIIIYKKDKKKV